MSAICFEKQSRIYIGTQSHYREVQRWEIFMEQELRFGPVGNTEKKGSGPIMNNF